MSEEEPSSLLKVVDTESPAVPLSDAERAGALLRVSREGAGYTLEALAAVVKVPVRKLEALETGRLDVLPESVFVRGMVVGICRVLHADPQAILALLPMTPTQHLKHQGAIAPVPFQTVGADSPYRLLEVVAKPHVRWALTFVLGAALLYCWPTIASWTMQSAEDPSAFSALQPWVAKGKVASAPEQGTVNVPPVFEPSADVNPSAAFAPLGSQASGPDQLSPTEELIHLKARGKTWIEVVDGKGVVVLRRNLADGEQTGAGGQPPLSVVIGNTDVTEVWVRGKAYEIKSISQGNVARFEVK